MGDALVTCDVCGKDLPDGTRAYAFTAGWIDDECYGFMQNTDEAWITVVCRDCGRRINEEIAKMSHVHLSGQ